MPMKNSPRRRGVKRKVKEEEVDNVVLEEVQEQVVIQSAEGRSQVVIRGQDGSMIIQDMGEDDPLTGQTEVQEQYVIQTTEEEQVINGEEVVTEYQEENITAEKQFRNEKFWA